MGSFEVPVFSTERHHWLTDVHVAAKGNTLNALDTYFPLNSPQGKRTELATMASSKHELFSVCGNDYNYLGSRFPLNAGNIYFLMPYAF